MMDINKRIKNITLLAKEASRRLRFADAQAKDRALKAMAGALVKNKAAIIRENKKDIKKARGKKVAASFIDRLALDASRIKKMAGCLREIADLKDPLGQIAESWQRPNGLQIMKLRVPLGVIGVIYEARPNVTSDCVGLCLKSGNALILRGGSLAFNSNMAVFKVLREQVLKAGLPEGAINMIDTTDRRAVRVLLRQADNVDLIIPRGGESLIKEVAKNSRIPVLKHYKGLCHIYIDECADLNMAETIVINAKVQRPSVCNAVETLLVHEHIACRLLPMLIRMLKEQGVEIRGCARTRQIVKDISRATAKDWQTEYLDKIISIKVVSDIDEAICHINRYSSGLSEVIISDSCQSAEHFLGRVDSACVYLNASSRFTDGNQFGLGAEIGISTGKLHARGPVGIKELTSYKYVVLGNGQIRSK